MDIKEMHVVFRELAQQMGMQTARAILSEDIDICLNTVIQAKVNRVIKDNVTTIPYNDKVGKFNNSVSSMNILRTLYRKENITEEEFTGTGTEIDPYTTDIMCSDIMLFTSFKISYDDIKLYDCRIIESEHLTDTLHDYCNRASKSAPICTITGDNYCLTLDIFNNTKDKPKILQYWYIAHPAKVQLIEEDETMNVDCDLPSYIHSELVTDAVNLYLASIGAIRSNKKEN